MNPQVLINDRLGQLIRDTRRRRGWTLEGLHARLLAAGGPAPSVPSLSRIERGYATFTAQEAACACRVLGISWHTLQRTLRVQRIGTPPIPVEALLARAAEFYMIGAHEELLGGVETAYDRCIATAGSSPDVDDELLFTLAINLSFLHRSFDNWDMSRHYARTILDMPGANDVRRVLAHTALMSTDALTGNWAGYVPRRMAVQSFARRLEGAQLAFVTMSMGVHETLRGSYDEGRKWLEFSLPIYTELGNLNTLRGTVVLGRCLAGIGRVAEGVELIHGMREEALAKGYLHVVGFASRTLRRIAA